MEIDRNGLEVLGRDESLRLLSTAVLGRIAITSGALPTVLPVNFRYDGRRILFSTGSGTKLSAATSHAVVAFEVDSIDPAAETGWSVVVTGMAEEVVDPDDLAEARRAAGALGAGAGQPHRGHLARPRVGAAHPGCLSWPPVRPAGCGNVALGSAPSTDPSPPARTSGAEAREPSPAADVGHGEQQLQGGLGPHGRRIADRDPGGDVVGQRVESHPGSGPRQDGEPVVEASGSPARPNPSA